MTKDGMLSLKILATQDIKDLIEIMTESNFVMKLDQGNREKIKMNFDIESKDNAKGMV